MSETLISEDLILTHRRYVETASTGQTLYKLQVSCSQGSNPTIEPNIDNHVFVMSILDDDSSASDTFTRVATISDMDLMNTVRDTAVQVEHTFYRVATITLTYDNLDTALAVIPVLRDRVNNLVTIYNKAVGSFLTPTSDADYPARFTLPASSEVVSIKNSLIAAYTSARDARATAESDQAAAQSSFDAVQATSDNLLKIKHVRCSVSQSLSGIRPGVDSAIDALSSAAESLEQAASHLNKTTQVVASFTCGPTHLGSINGNSLDPNEQVAIPHVDNPDIASMSGPQLEGQLVVVTPSPHNSGSDGKTQLRYIDAVHIDQVNGVTTLIVKQAFDFVPESGTYEATPARTVTFTTGGQQRSTVIDAVTGTFADTGTIRSFADFLMADDFGAITRAATRTREAFRAASGGGLRSPFQVMDSESTAQCSNATGEHASSESDVVEALSVLEAKKAATVAAQALETETLSGLQSYCPTIDISTL